MRAWVMACETEWREVDRNIANAVVSDCDWFIVVSCSLPLFLRCFFSILNGVLASVKSGVCINGVYRFIFTDNFLKHWGVFWIIGVEIVIPVGGGYCSGLVWHKEKVLFNGSWWHAGFECGVRYRKGNRPVQRRNGRKIGHQILFLLLACWCNIDLLSWDCLLTLSTTFADVVTSFRHRYTCLSSAGQPTFSWNFSRRESLGCLKLHPVQNFSSHIIAVMKFQGTPGWTPNPTSFQTPNTIIRRGQPTRKGGTLKFHHRNDAGRKILYGMSL